MSDSEEGSIRPSQDNTHGAIGVKVLLGGADNTGGDTAMEQGATPKHSVSVVVTAGVEKDGDVAMKDEGGPNPS